MMMYIRSSESLTSIKHFLIQRKRQRKKAANNNNKNKNAQGWEEKEDDDTEMSVGEIDVVEKLM